MSDTPSNVVTNDGRPNMVPGGHADEEPGLQTDDFGLGGNMRDQLVAALEKRWNPDDPGATTLDDEPAPDPADTAATPAPAPDTSTQPDPTQAEPSQEGDGGGRAADPGEGAAASTPDPSAAPAPDPNAEFDAGQYLSDYFGTNLTRDQAQALAGMIGGLQALSPDQRAYLDRVLAGGEVGQYPATMGVPAQPGGQPTGQPIGQPQPGQPQMVGQVAPTAPTDDPATRILGARPDADADPYAAQVWDMNAATVRASQQQIDAMRAEIAATTQAEQQRQLAATQARIDTTVDTWRAAHTDLSDAEFDALKARAERSGTFPALVAAHHGDIDAATSALLEQTYWSDPALRDRAIANMKSGRAPGDHTAVDPNSEVARGQAQADAGRQALAASVAGGGGALTPSTGAVPTDPDQRKAAMVQEIAANHNDWG